MTERPQPDRRNANGAEHLRSDASAAVAAERASIAADLAQPFDLWLPEQQWLPLVFSSPHSGRIYPKALLNASQLDPITLRRSEDCFVDELIAGAAQTGVPLLAARFPRAYVDVNREPYELDPALFLEIPPFANIQSHRVAGGLGTVPRIVADGEDIYAHRLPLGVGLARIEALYHPFHAALAAQLEETRRRFGVAVLIDWHSMPSNGPLSVPGAASGSGNRERPHFVLGDRFGTACGMELTHTVRDGLGKLGYEVHLNRPYAGGYITEYYGKPAYGVHALQIEINRALYMDEAALAKTPDFERVANDLTRVVMGLAALWPNVRRSRPAAAAE